MILSCLSYLYTLKINPLSVVLFAIIFSHSEDSLLIVFIVSFAVQKLLNFIRSHLFIFVFVSVTLGGGSKRILLWFMSKSVLPLFFSKSFVVSGLTFKFLICFECILYSTSSLHILSLFFLPLESTEKYFIHSIRSICRLP